MQVEISEVELTYLNPAARGELERQVKAYADDLLQEAGRLEGAQRSTAGDPEITSTIVKDADTGLRRNYVRPSRSGWSVLLQVVSYVGAIAAAVAATELDELWGQIVFAIAVTVGVIAIAVMELRK